MRAIGAKVHNADDEKDKKKGDGEELVSDSVGKGAAPGINPDIWW